MSLPSPDLCITPGIPVIRTIVTGLSGNMVSNQLTRVSRQKDSWCFYNETINVFSNESGQRYDRIYKAGIPKEGK